MGFQYLICAETVSSDLGCLHVKGFVTHQRHIYISLILHLCWGPSCAHRYTTEKIDLICLDSWRHWLTPIPPKVCSCFHSVMFDNEIFPLSCSCSKWSLALMKESCVSHFICVSSPFRDTFFITLESVLVTVIVASDIVAMGQTLTFSIHTFAINLTEEVLPRPPGLISRRCLQSHSCHKWHHNLYLVQWPQSVPLVAGTIDCIFSVVNCDLSIVNFLQVLVEWQKAPFWQPLLCCKHKEHGSNHCCAALAAPWLTDVLGVPCLNEICRSG